MGNTIFSIMKKYKEEFEEDIKIEEDNIDMLLSKIPHIHSKWMYKSIVVSRGMEEREARLNIIYKQIYGELKTQSDFRVDASHISKLIEGDERYILALRKYNDAKLINKFLESVIKKITDVNFIVENIIAYKRFVNGK